MALDMPQMRSTSMDLDPVLSFAPVAIPAPERGEMLQLRVSLQQGDDPLPIILFSHGMGQSHHGYAPLVNFWAASGYAVIQPTHLDSRMLALAKDDPRAPDFWRFREHDLKAVLDNLDTIEAAHPEFAGRFDRTRIAVAGHSWGAQTASMLLGARHPDPGSGAAVDIADARIKAGVLLAIPGMGGANLTPFAAEHLPFMHPEFAGMSPPALIVAGDKDQSPLTARGPDWWRDAYDLSPGRKALFTAFGGEHSLGGIANYEAAETTDESPERVAAIQRISVAFLDLALKDRADGWDKAIAAVSEQGSIETKGLGQ